MKDDALTPADRELLAELLSDHHKADDVVVRRRLADSPVLAREYEQLQRIAMALGKSGSDERDSVAEAVGATTPEDVAFATDFVRRNAHELPRRRMWRRHALVAAALIALTLIINAVWQSRREGANPYLGGASQSFELQTRRGASPIGFGAEFGEFRWHMVAGVDGYRVSIYSVDQDRRPVGDPVMVHDVEQNSWRPGAQDLETLRQLRAIAWSVVSFDSGTGQSQAWLNQVFATELPR